MGCPSKSKGGSKIGIGQMLWGWAFFSVPRDNILGKVSKFYDYYVVWCYYILALYSVGLHVS